MNIRKHWKKILLTTTAFFWAGCSGDSVTDASFHPESSSSEANTPSSSSILGTSSSESVPTSSSSEQVSSSSESAPTSSSSEVASSSSEMASSSSGEVTCAPGDSIVSYYPPSYSADIAKMNAEERAKMTGVEKIDSTKNTLLTPPQCLDDLRQEIDDFVALYGAPVRFPKDSVCSDGTKRPTKEYLEYQQMKEEWEKNKPALDEECKKIYDEKLDAIQQKLNQCMSTSTSAKKIACDLEAMCPEYGVDSRCSYDYRCEDGASCWESTNNTINCTDKNGNSVTYTEEEFKAKYYGKSYH